MTTFINDIEEFHLEQQEQQEQQNSNPELAQEAKLSSEELDQPTSQTTLMSHNMPDTSLQQNNNELNKNIVVVTELQPETVVLVANKKDENEGKGSASKIKKKKQKTTTTGVQSQAQKLQITEEVLPKKEVEQINKNNSPLGILPPLKNERNLLKKPIEAAANQQPQQPQQQPQQPLKDDNSKKQQQPNQKLERYNSKMQTINEADDALLEESLQNLNNLLESNKLKNSKLKHLFKISDNLKIDSDEEIEEQKGESNGESVAQSQQGLLDGIRNSKETYEKIKNYMHQIISYNQILQDEQLQKSVIRQFDYQREAFWKFQNEQLEDITTSPELKLLVITWNLQGGLPSSDLKKLLVGNMHHLIAIGTQECQRSIPTSVFFESKDKWEKMIKEAIGEQYLMIKSVTMNAMHLTIIIHHSLYQQVSRISSDSEATGIANIIGNKGGIGIQLSIGKKSYLFINSHFASGQNNSKKRNKDAEMVQKKLLTKQELKSKLDFVFWMGDLNYRIQQVNDETVRKMIFDKKFIELLMIDQLLLEKEQGNVMLNFKEGMIMFPPTYKLQKEINIHPQGGDTRIPGWTDRILYTSKQEEELKQVNYDCAINMFGSDHRPVFSQFLCRNELIEKGGDDVQVKAGSSTCEIF